MKKTEGPEVIVIDIISNLDQLGIGKIMEIINEVVRVMSTVLLS